MSRLARSAKSNAEKRHSTLLLVILTVLCLAPFAGKAFHIDDPLFLWNAQNIQRHPFDPYGFSVNWKNAEMPMWEVTRNPPLASYYLALAASVVGWGEVGLHLFFLLPATAAVLGVHALARRLCKSPLPAALATLLTPVFLVSSTSLMCDVMMLAFWVWAIEFWIRGLQHDRPWILVAASFLMAGAAMTKYFGIALIPLLAVYSIWQRRGFGCWAPYLFIPVLILGGYQWATHALYGRGLLLDAAAFATEHRAESNAQLFRGNVIALAFAGGCVVTVLFYAPLLWSKWALAAGAALAAVGSGLLTDTISAGSFWAEDAGLVLLQVSIFATAGFSLLALAVVDSLRSRSAESALLLLWIFGTFLFAGTCNWTVNARSILPMAPAAAILIYRRIEQRNVNARWRVLPLIPTALLALAVTWTDYTFANSARAAALTIRAGKQGDTSVWFQGHWGFQYYMQARGFKSINILDTFISPGDIIAIPRNNTGTFELPDGSWTSVQTFSVPTCSWLSTMSPWFGSGFYADVWGPLPFAIGSLPAEEYEVVQADLPIKCKRGVVSL